MLRIDGLFLTLVGGAQTLLDLLGYLGVGPQSLHFEGRPYVIGFFEAHGLAALAGLAVFAVSRRSYDANWHAWAASIHLLLGAANLVFWEAFQVYDMTAAGYGATVVHAGFLVVQTIAWMRLRAQPYIARSNQNMARTEA